MGILHSGLFGSAKLHMPFGPPPCVEDSHKHAHIQPPPPVPGVPELQAKVSMANDYVEKEFQALIATRYKMKDIAHKAQQDWNEMTAPLEESCNNTRDKLSQLAAETGECEEAQHTELANLFEKRAKVPPMFKAMTKIEGCADFKNDDHPTKVGDCKCAAGNELDGCRTAAMESDHTLLCTHLRKRVLPRLALWRMTSPGGACHVDAKTPYNHELLARGVPKDFVMPKHEESSIPPLLLVLEPPRRPSAAERRDRDQRVAAMRARAFL